MEEQAHDTGSPAQERGLLSQCGYCQKDLAVPENIAMKVNDMVRSGVRPTRTVDSLLGKQHGDVYVSNYGGYFCNRDCAVLFTED